MVASTAKRAETLEVGDVFVSVLRGRPYATVDTVEVVRCDGGCGGRLINVGLRLEGDTGDVYRPRTLHSGDLVQVVTS